LSWEAGHDHVSITHIDLDEKGVAWISGNLTKVVELVVDRMAHGSTPEEMHLQYPHLTLGQIHAALAYYHDHQVEIDQEIGRRWKDGDDLALKNADPALRQKLLALKKRP
jgi:uncharacterized protein (DUF433 family)